MKLKHTHRTTFVRSDYELGALHVILLFNGEDPTPAAIEGFESKFRGHPEFEKSLRKVAHWLKEFNPDFKAEEHDCGGQMCDQDGAFDVSLVRRNEKS